MRDAHLARTDWSADSARGFEQSADALHDSQIKREIVDGVEGSGERLAGLHEVAQVRAGEAAAGGAAAGGVGRVPVFGVLFVLDVEAAFAGEEQGVTGGAGGKNAVHHVDAEARILLDLVGIADAHDITRLVPGEERQDFRDHFQCEFARLADGEAADGVAVEVHCNEALGAMPAEIGVHATLHDAEALHAAVFWTRTGQGLCYPRSQNRNLGRAFC